MQAKKEGTRLGKQGTMNDRVLDMESLDEAPSSLLGASNGTEMLSASNGTEMLGASNVTEMLSASNGTEMGTAVKNDLPSSEFAHKLSNEECRSSADDADDETLQTEDCTLTSVDAIAEAID